MRKSKKIKIKPIRFHLNTDIDRDGIYDWKDCKPFNPHKQDLGPSEYKLENEEDYHKLYIKVQSNAYKEYDKNLKKARQEVKEIAYYITRLKTEKRNYSAVGPWNRTERGLPSFQFQTGYYPHPNIPGQILEIYDGGHDVYLYIDITGYMGKYSSIYLNENFQRGWGSGLMQKLILIITALDKEKIGPYFPEFMKYVYYNEYKK